LAEWRGVNLGGWLVLEKWITPSLFSGTLATDEFGLMSQLHGTSLPNITGQEAASSQSDANKATRLQQHRASFITEPDIAWIRDHGMNAIRLPVPHWVFGGFEPYVECQAQVDWLLDMATKYDLKVLIDLHTAPGSQNGYDHSGQAGQINWHKDQASIDQTVAVIRQLAERYGQHPQVIGFELLNEIHSKVPTQATEQYYLAAQAAVAPLAPGKLSIIGDCFAPVKWQSFAGQHNMALDSHHYQVFTNQEKRMSLVNHIKKAKYDWADLIAGVQRYTPQIVGEWSAALDNQTFRGFDAYERDKGYLAYATAQIECFNKALGWFYWTLKTEDDGAWSCQAAVKRGWLPSSFSDVN